MGHWCDMHLSLQDGYTPLMKASLDGHDGCVQLLLDRGAQIDHQDEVSAFTGFHRVKTSRGGGISSVDTF